MLRCGVRIEASVALDLWLNYGVFTGERRSADPGRHHVTTTCRWIRTCYMQPWLPGSRSRILHPRGHMWQSRTYRTPKMAGLKIKGRTAL